MLWRISNRASKRALPLANRHYSRQKPGTPQFVKPGRCIVLLTEDETALWVSSWPFPQFTKHAWPGAWECSVFRNEGLHLASDLIRDAVAATRFIWGELPALPLGMVTFIDPKEVRQKPRKDYGMCYQKAGWRLLEQKTEGGLFVLQALPNGLVEAEPPRNYQRHLIFS